MLLHLLTRLGNWTSQAEKASLVVVAVRKGGVENAVWMVSTASHSYVVAEMNDCPGMKLDT